MRQIDGKGCAAALVFVLVVLASPTPAARTLTLIANGKSDYKILVARQRGKGAIAKRRMTPEFAAMELRDLLKKSTGADLPIVRRWADGEKYLICLST